MDRYCRACGKKLNLQGGDWTINGKKFVMLYCPTAGKVEVEDDGWIKDTHNKGHDYELISRERLSNDN
jgi:hypothetical protein